MKFLCGRKTVLISSMPSIKEHYYKNDFVRHCPNINGGGLKIHPPRKMPQDFRRQTFLFMEAVTINRHAKCIYKSGRFIYGGG
jgi:hypothetical protein